MRRKRIVFIVLGWVFIFINAAGWLAVISAPDNRYAPHGLPQLIGFNFWFALGFLMLFLAGKEKRKMVRQKEQQEFDEFLVE